jgi:hypothetical protein
VALRIEDFSARVPGISQALTSISMRLYKDLQAVSASGFLPLGFQVSGRRRVPLQKEVPLFIQTPCIFGAPAEPESTNSHRGGPRNIAFPRSSLTDRFAQPFTPKQRDSRVRSMVELHRRLLRRNGRCCFPSLLRIGVNAIPDRDRLHPRGPNPLPAAGQRQ